MPLQPTPVVILHICKPNQSTNKPRQRRPPSTATIKYYRLVHITIYRNIPPSPNILNIVQWLKPTPR